MNLGAFFQYLSGAIPVAYAEVKAFFSTGLFYITLGCAFLYMAVRYQHLAHSAFIFMLAILGIAIVLYGTGTQASGGGNTGQANVAIAGGAGVLAVVFGFGVISYQQQIQNVFKQTRDYGILELKGDDQKVDLSEYEIVAELPDGRPLHLWKKGQRVEIIIPILGFESTSAVHVQVTPRLLSRDFRGEFDRIFNISWKSGEMNQGLDNEVVVRKKEDLQLKRSELTIAPEAEKASQTGKKIEPLVIEPQ